MPAIVLSIAGSDPGGGAGIQADLKTFQAFDAYGTTAVTAVTVQNTRGVQAVHPVPAEIVRAQIRAVAEDLPPRAFKTGMLATPETAQAVADVVLELALPNYVLDPVLAATSGARLLERGAESIVRERLLRLAALVTPNLDEAALLTGEPVRTEEEMRRAAEALVDAGAAAALVKGGHLCGGELVDVLYDGREFRAWRHPRIGTRHTHGTGCTLSAAVAAGLAHGRPLPRAVEDALAYVQRAIASAPGLGSGRGPLNFNVES